jgi:predicted ATP-binding protein involved in virulence
VGYLTNEVFGATLLTIFSSDVESLKQGIIKTSKNKVQADYTILLVGETGVGKSAVLEYLANVLTGKNIDRYDFEIIDRSNEQNGSSNQSQTNSARLYKLTSNNGIVVCASQFEHSE